MVVLLVSIPSLHIFKEQLVVSAIHSIFDEGLKGLADVPEGKTFVHPKWFEALQASLT